MVVMIRNGSCELLIWYMLVLLFGGTKRTISVHNVHINRRVYPDFLFVAKSVVLITQWNYNFYDGNKAPCSITRCLWSGSNYANTMRQMRYSWREIFGIAIQNSESKIQPKRQTVKTQLRHSERLQNEWMPIHLVEVCCLTLLHLYFLLTKNQGLVEDVF